MFDLYNSAFACKAYIGIQTKYSLFSLDAFKVSKKAKIRNRYNQVTHLTKVTKCESDDTNIRKHHIQESQEVNPFPSGVHEATMNRQESMTNAKHK